MNVTVDNPFSSAYHGKTGKVIGTLHDWYVIKFDDPSLKGFSFKKHELKFEEIKVVNDDFDVTSIALELRRYTDLYVGAMDYMLANRLTSRDKFLDSIKLTESLIEHLKGLRRKLRNLTIIENSDIALLQGVVENAIDFNINMYKVDLKADRQLLETLDSVQYFNKFSECDSKKDVVCMLPFDEIKIIKSKSGLGCKAVKSNTLDQDFMNALRQGKHLDVSTLPITK